MNWKFLRWEFFRKIYPQFKKGERVKVWYQHHNEYYLGTVEKVQLFCVEVVKDTGTHRFANRWDVEKYTPPSEKVYAKTDTEIPKLGIPPEEKCCENCKWMEKYAPPFDAAHYWLCKSPRNRKPTYLTKLKVSLNEFTPIHAHCEFCRKDNDACGNSNWWDWNGK